MLPPYEARRLLRGLCSCRAEHPASFPLVESQADFVLAGDLSIQHVCSESVGIQLRQDFLARVRVRAYTADTARCAGSCECTVMVAHDLCASGVVRFLAPFRRSLPIDERRRVTRATASGPNVCASGRTRGRRPPKTPGRGLSGGAGGCVSSTELNRESRTLKRKRRARWET